MQPQLIPLLAASIYQAIDDLVLVNPSQVEGDLDAIESGPCGVRYKSLLCGHTVGGVKLSIKPLFRERKIDETGENVVDLMYTGDRVEVKTAFTQRSMRVIQTVYQFGSLVSSTVWGVGRRPLVRATAVAGELVLHPLSMGESTTKDVTFFKAAVIGTGDVQVGSIGQDQVFECTFLCLTDPTRDDGQLIGTIGVP